MNATPGSTLLYVEDHFPARLLMEAIIAEMGGCRLALAASGAEARVLAAELHPDLYIVDLDLPDTDGLALIVELRQLHAAPVVLVSAYAEAVKEASVRALVYAYLAKPLDPDFVVETIQRALA